MLGFSTQLVSSTDLMLSFRQPFNVSFTDILVTLILAILSRKLMKIVSFVAEYVDLNISLNSIAKILHTE